MVAEFLHYFPQYRLDDLASMPTPQFVWLYLGMVDNVRPEQTEPLEAIRKRRLDEIMRKNMEAAKGGGRR